MIQVVDFTNQMLLLPNNESDDSIAYDIDFNAVPVRDHKAPIRSNFASLSMEWSHGGIPLCFHEDHFGSEVGRLITQMKPTGSTLPQLIRIGGNSVMKLQYQESKFRYPNYVYLKQFIGDEVLATLGTFGDRTGIQFIVALPLIESNIKYAVEWAKACVEHIGRESIYAFELGNEPNHWGDDKPGEAMAFSYSSIIFVFEC